MIIPSLCKGAAFCEYISGERVKKELGPIEFPFNGISYVFIYSAAEIYTTH